MYCITVRGSSRAPVVKSELARVGLLETTTVLTFERNVEDGKHGCFTSHQEALKRGLDDKADAITIFEDDVIFRNRGDLHALLTQAKAIVRSRPDSLVALGGLLMAPTGGRVEGYPHFRYVPWACTHAYVVSPVMARKIGALRYENEHIDAVIKTHYGHAMIACVPSVAFQRPYYSAAELTLTEATYYYRALIVGRNMISPTVVQLAFEYFFRTIGFLKACKA